VLDDPVLAVHARGTWALEHMGAVLVRDDVFCRDYVYPRIFDHEMRITPAAYQPGQLG
jgi:hypothetical protein